MGLGAVRLGSSTVLVHYGQNSALYISEPAGIHRHSQTISCKETLSLFAVVSYAMQHAVLITSSSVVFTPVSKYTVSQKN